MKKILKWLFAALIAIFALLQFTNPSRTNPPVKNDFLAAENPPPEIAATLRAACYDCHSDETRWPWYSRVAPVSWLVASDVNHGRKHLNLSEWPDGNSLRAWKKMEDMSEEIGYEEMPLKKYTLIHADARLTENQRKELIQWLDAKAAQLKSVTGKK
jgi:Haem-binding domain